MKTLEKIKELLFKDHSNENVRKVLRAFEPKVGDFWLIGEWVYVTGDNPHEWTGWFCADSGRAVRMINELSEAEARAWGIVREITEEAA